MAKQNYTIKFSADFKDFINDVRSLSTELSNVFSSLNIPTDDIASITKQLSQSLQDIINNFGNVTDTSSMTKGLDEMDVILKGITEQLSGKRFKGVSELRDNLDGLSQSLQTVKKNVETVKAISENAAQVTNQAVSSTVSSVAKLTSAQQEKINSLKKSISDLAKYKQSLYDTFIDDDDNSVNDSEYVLETIGDDEEVKHSIKEYRELIKSFIDYSNKLDFSRLSPTPENINSFIKAYEAGTEFYRLFNNGEFEVSFPEFDATDIKSKFESIVDVISSQYEKIIGVIDEASSKAKSSISEITNSVNTTTTSISTTNTASGGDILEERTKLRRNSTVTVTLELKAKKAETEFDNLIKKFRSEAGDSKPIELYVDPDIKIGKTAEASVEKIRKELSDYASQKKITFPAKISFTIENGEEVSVGDAVTESIKDKNKEIDALVKKTANRKPFSYSNSAQTTVSTKLSAEDVDAQAAEIIKRYQEAIDRTPGVEIKMSDTADIKAVSNLLRNASQFIDSPNITLNVNTDVADKTISDFYNRNYSLAQKPINFAIGVKGVGDAQAEIDSLKNSRKNVTSIPVHFDFAKARQEYNAFIEEIKSIPVKIGNTNLDSAIRSLSSNNVDVHTVLSEGDAQKVKADFDSLLKGLRSRKPVKIKLSDTFSTSSGDTEHPTFDIKANPIGIDEFKTRVTEALKDLSVDVTVNPIIKGNNSETGKRGNSLLTSQLEGQLNKQKGIVLKITKAESDAFDNVSKSVTKFITSVRNSTKSVEKLVREVQDLGITKSQVRTAVDGAKSEDASRGSSRNQPSANTSEQKEHNIQLEKAKSLISDIIALHSKANNLLVTNAKLYDGSNSSTQKKVETEQKILDIDTQISEKEIEIDRLSKLTAEDRESLTQQLRSELSLLEAQYNQRLQAVEADRQHGDVLAERKLLYDQLIEAQKKYNDFNKQGAKAGYEGRNVDASSYFAQRDVYGSVITQTKDAISQLGAGLDSVREEQLAKLVRDGQSALTKLAISAGKNIGQAVVQGVSGNGGVEPAIQSLLGDSLKNLNIEQIADGKWVATGRDANGVFKELTYTYNANTDALFQLEKAHGAASNSLGKFGEFVKKWTSNLGRYVGVYMSAMQFIREIRNGFTYVKELDTALSELRMVTLETDEAMERIASDAKDVASSVASTTTEVVKSTTSWSRLGYTMEQSLGLAASAAKLARAGFMDIDTATQHLTSSIQAFFGTDIKNGTVDAVEAAQQLTDKMIQVGNNLPITAEGIGAALERSAGTLVAAGNSLDESIGLLSAANATIQNPEKVGTAFQTIAMRLRGTKVSDISNEVGIDLEGMSGDASKLYEKVKKLTAVASNGFEGVSILTESGAYKSTAQILLEIADAYQEINDINKAALTEELAGKRQASILSALLNNPDLLKKGIEQSADAFGATEKAMETAMDSIDAKLAEAKNNWQSFWQTLIQSETVKKILDIIIKITEALDKLAKSANGVGGTSAIIAALFGGKTGISSLINNGKSGGVFNWNKQGISLFGKSLKGNKNALNLGDAVLGGSDLEVFRKYFNNNGFIGNVESIQKELRGLGIAEEQAANMADVFISKEKAANGVFNNMLTSVPAAGDSMGLFSHAMSGVKDVAASLGKTLVTSLVNGGLALLASFLIGKGIEAISNFSNRLDIAIEKSRKFKDEIASEAAQYQSNIEAINGFKDELETLAEGVDDYGNNVSLTSEQYERYKSLVAQLVAMDPDIARSYTAHKGYIIDVKTALEDAVKAQQDFNNNAILEGTYGEGLKTVFSGLGAEYQSATQDYLKTTGYSVIDLASMSADEEVAARNGLLSEAWNKAFNSSTLSKTTNAKDFVKSVVGPEFKDALLWFDENEALIAEHADSLVEAIKESTDFDALDEKSKNELNKSLELIEKWANSYDDYAKRIEGVNDGIRQNFKDFLVGTDYEKLDDVSKSYIDDYINNISIDDVLKRSGLADGAKIWETDKYDVFEGDIDAIHSIQTHLKKQIELLASGIDLSSFTDRLENLSTSMSSKDYQKAVDGIYQEISDAFYDKTKERLDIGTIQAALDFEPVNAKTNERITDENMRTYLNDVLKEALPDDISREDIELAYNIAVDLRADDAGLVFENYKELLNQRNAKLMSDSVPQKFIQSYDQLATSVENYGQALSTINDVSLDNTKITVENGAAIANLLSQDEELQKILASNRELTDDQIETVKNSISANQDLSGVIEAVFDDTNTLTGYIVKDTDALRKLTGENLKSSDAYKDLKSAQDAAVTKYAELTRKLAEATSGTQEFDEEQMANIRGLQSQIRDVQGLIDKYALLEQKLLGAADGFTKFDQAKQADAANNYGSQLLEMLSTLDEGLKKKAPGSEAFRAALEAIVPEDFEPSKAVLDRVKDYGDTLLEQGFVSLNEDKTGFEITIDNFDNFIKAGENLGVFEQVGDDFRDFTIKSGTSLESLAEAFGLTKETAFALLTEFQNFNDSSTGSFSFLDDLLARANNASLGIYDLNEEIQKLKSSIADIEITDDIKNVYQRFTGGEQPLQQTQADLQTLTKYADDAGVSVEELYEAIKTSLKVDELDAQLKEMETSVGTDETFTPTVKENLDEISSAINEVIKLYDSTGGYIEENSKAADELKSKIQECQSVYSGLTDIAINQQNNIASLLEQYNNLKTDAADIESKMASLPADSQEYANYATQLSNINTSLGDISDKLIKIGDPSQYTGVAIDAVDARIAEQQKIINDAETRVNNIQNLLDHATNQDVINTYTTAKNEAQAVLDNANTALNVLENQKAVINAIDPESQEQFNSAIERLNEFSDVSISVFGELLDGYDSVIDKVTELQTHTSEFLNNPPQATFVENSQKSEPSYNTSGLDGLAEAQDRYNQSLSKTATYVKTTDTTTQEFDNTLGDLETSGTNTFDRLKNGVIALGDALLGLVTKGAQAKKAMSLSSDPTYQLLNHAYATGGVSVGGRSLVGELGQELVVSNGRYRTVGDRGPEFVHLKKGDIVFNHLQTEQLLKHNRTSLRGRALASGNAYDVMVPQGRSPSNYTGGSWTDGSSKSSPSKSSASSAAKEWTEAFTKAAEEIKKEFERHLLEGSGYVKTEMLKDVEEVDSKILDALDAYTEDLQAIKDLGFDTIPDQTVFGNIDLNNRQVLQWTQETVDQFWDALKDHVEKDTKPEDMIGGISTVLGESDEFDGIEIAFSPMLQTENGPVVLSRRTIHDYIGTLIRNAGADGAGWTNEELFALDAQGLEFEGLQIKNIIADIGETAERTGKVMHYLGTDGALNQNLQTLTKAAQDAGMSLDQYVTKLNQVRAKEQLQNTMQYTSRQIAEAQYFSSLTALYRQYYAQYGQASEENAQKLKDLWTGLHDSYVSELDSQYNDGKISLMSYLSSMKSAYQAFYSNIEGYAQECADAQIAYAQKVRNAYQSMFSGMSTLIGFQIGELTAARDEAVSALETERDAAIAAIDEQIEAIDEEIDHYNELIEAVQEEIDEKQKEIDAIRKAAEERKRDLELQKAQYNLARAQNQRTEYVYTAEKGFVYRTNADDEREAREDIRQQEEEQRIAVIELEIEKLEEVIEGYEKKIKELEKEKKALEKQKKAIQKFYDEQIKAVQEFYDKQIEGLEKIQKAIERFAKFEELQTAMKILNEFGYTLQDLFSGNINFEQLIRGWADAMATSMGPEAFDSIMKTAELLGVHIDELNTNADKLTLGAQSIKSSTALMTENAEPMKGVAQAFQDAAKGAGELADTSTKMSTAVDTLTQSMTALAGDGTTNGLTAISAAAKELTSADLTAFSNSIQTLGSNAQVLSDMAQSVRDIVQALAELQATSGEGGGLTSMIASLGTLGSNLNTISTNLGQFKSTLDTIFGGAMAAAGGQGQAPGAAAGQQQGAAGGGGIFGAFLQELDTLVANTDQGVTTMIDKWTEFQELMNAIFGEGGGEGSGGEGEGGEGEGGGKGSVENLRTMLQETSTAIDEYMLSGEKSVANSFKNALVEGDGSALGSLQRLHDEGITLVEELKNAIIELLEALNSALEQFGTIASMAGALSAFGGGGEGGQYTGTATNKWGHYASGTAHNQGTWGLKHNEKNALVGELGYETLIRDGQYYIIGENGPETMSLKKDDIILNHEQSEDVFRDGKVARNKKLDALFGHSHAMGTFGVGSRATAQAKGVAAQRNAQASSAAGPGSFNLLVSQLTALNGAIESLSQADLNDIAEDLARIQNTNIEMVTTQLQTLSQHATQFQTIALELSNMQMQLQTLSGTDYFTPLNTQFQTFLAQFTVLATQFQTQVQNMFAGLSSAVAGSGANPAAQGGAGAAIAGAGAVGAEAGTALANGAAGAAGGGSGGIFGAFLDQLTELNGSTDDTLNQMTDRWTQFKDDIGTIIGVGEGGGEGEGEGGGGGRKSSSSGGSGEGGEGGSADSIIGVMDLAAETIQDTMLNEHLPMLDELINTGEPSLHSIVDEGCHFIIEQVEYIIEIVTHAIEQINALLAMGDQIRGVLGGVSIGHAAGTAHYAGTALTGGSWGLKRTEHGALVGEIGPETLVRNGRYQIIGEHGPERMNLRKGDIIFNAAQTASIFKYGKVKGASHADGTLAGIIPGFTKAAMPDVFEKFVDMLSNIEVNVQKLVPPVNAPALAAAGVGSVTNTNSTNNNGQTFHVDNLSVTLPNASPDSIEALANDLSGIKAKMLQRFNKLR